MARLAFDSGVPVDAADYAVGNFAAACFPLKAPMRVRGVLAVRPLDDADTIHAHKALLETIASLVAIAVERLHYVEVVPPVLASPTGDLARLFEALEADHEFLLKGNVFTQDLIENWIAYKMDTEVNPVRLRPVPYEFHLYYDI